MLLTDAVHAIEMVGGVWLGISAVGFILLALFAEIRRKSAAVDVDARRDRLADSTGPSVRVATTEKRPISHKPPTRKAA
jgi:hypothetical protein